MRSQILLAEDDTEMRRFLSERLTHDGYDVTAASDGTEVLEALSQLSRSAPPSRRMPNIIVMDVHMPGYSGLHVLTALRNAGWTTPVILITAFGDSKTHDTAKRLGATAVFDKPFDLDDLRTAILNLLPSH